MSTICIIDYDVGNIHSVMKAVRLYTDRVILSDKTTDIENAAGIILPGQGAFNAGMDGLKKRNLIGLLQNKALLGTPILGICLGAQLLLEKGYEFGEHSGLGLLPGKVQKFPSLQDVKTPHMGWNSIDAPSDKRWENTPLHSLAQGAEMYFIHSYILQPDLSEHIVANTSYGGLQFPSVIGKGNITGCQFHPEKSGTEGLKIIENFVQLVEQA